MVLCRAVTAFAGHSENQRAWRVAVFSSAEIEIRSVAVHATLRNRSCVRGVAIDVSGTVDPLISIGDVRDVVLVEAVFVPVQIGLCHFGRSHDDLHRHVETPIEKVSPLKELIPFANHLETDVGIGSQERVGAGLEVAVDRRFVDRTTGFEMSCRQERFVEIAMALLTCLWSHKPRVFVFRGRVGALARQRTGAERDFNTAAAFVFSNEPDVLVRNRRDDHVAWRRGGSGRLRFVFFLRLTLRFEQTLKLFVLHWPTTRIKDNPKDDRTDRQQREPTFKIQDAFSPEA